MMVFLIVRLVLLFYALSFYLDIFSAPVERGVIAQLVEEHGGELKIQEMLSKDNSRVMKGVIALQSPEEFEQLSVLSRAQSRPLVISIIAASLEAGGEQSMLVSLQKVAQDKPFSDLLFGVIDMENANLKPLLKHIFSMINIIQDPKQLPLTLFFMGDQIKMPIYAGYLDAEALKRLLKQR